MKELDATIGKVMDKMAELEIKRELALSMSRTIIRKTKNMIHAIHTEGEFMTIQGQLKEDMKSLVSKLKSDPAILQSQVVEDCMMEFSEALILSSIVRKKDMPTYETLKVSPQAWALGLCDTVGELRRLVLTNLMKNDMKKAQYYFDTMDMICNEIMKFDVPDAILPIRRKQDIARGVMEKTRSDMTNALMLERFSKPVEN